MRSFTLSEDSHRQYLNHIDPFVGSNKPLATFPSIVNVSDRMSRETTLVEQLLGLKGMLHRDRIYKDTAMKEFDLEVRQ